MWFDYIRLSDVNASDYNVYFSVPVPGNLTMDDISDVVHALVSRHEGLRTTHEVGDDGEPIQVVWPPQPIPVAGPWANDREDGYRRGIERLTREGFRLEEEWPLRAAVLRGDADGSRFLACAMHHIAADATAALVLHEEVHELLVSASEGRPAVLSEVQIQPVDLALRDAGEAGRQHNDATLRYLRSQLLTAPGHLFACAYVPPEKHGLSVACLRSPRLAAAAQTAGKLHGVTPATLLAGALAFFTAARSGKSICPVSILAANRHDHDLRRAVGNLIQTVTPCFDLGGAATFSGAVRSVFKGHLRALRHGRHSFAGAAELRAAVGLERGIEFRHGVTVNFVEMARPYSGVTAKEVEEIRGLSPGSEFFWEPSEPDPAIDLFLTVYASPNEITIALAGDDVLFGRDELRSAVLGMEQAVVSLAEGHDLSVAEVPGWHRAESDERADLARTESVVGSHPDSRGAVVSVSTDGQLVAYLSSASPTLTPEELRSYVQAQLHRFPGTRTPDWFVICEAAPPETRSVEEWRRLPALAQGSGRLGTGRMPRPRHEPAGPLEELRRCVRRVNGLDDISEFDTYTSGGGRVSRLAAVRNHLHARGLIPPRPEMFLTSRPLWDLASDVRQSEE